MGDLGEENARDDNQELARKDGHLYRSSYTTGRKFPPLCHQRPPQGFNTTTLFWKYDPLSNGTPDLNEEKDSLIRFVPQDSGDLVGATDWPYQTPDVVSTFQNIPSYGSSIFAKQTDSRTFNAGVTLSPVSLALLLLPSTGDETASSSSYQVSENLVDVIFGPQCKFPSCNASLKRDFNDTPTLPWNQTLHKFCLYPHWKNMNASKLSGPSHQFNSLNTNQSTYQNGFSSRQEVLSGIFSCFSLVDASPKIFANSIAEVAHIAPLL
ncbi:hypothetical protein CPB83DRAFT_840764 [Crepidotus variabilis]|uniref:Uncharacterized protein n=1 Tax=Crepidotus variabilis TaxID=179855 RepID=A0A9P6E441_9AGAR|nr:hypothetical protein CPB83DRAFT_840764 [Crepidotus variabilis]